MRIDRHERDLFWVILIINAMVLLAIKYYTILPIAELKGLI